MTTTETLTLSESGTMSEVKNDSQCELPAAINIHQLYLDHYQHVLRFVQRYLRNEEDAKDITQNTFIEALRSAHKFAGLSKPSTWLFGIALNLARGHVRKRYAAQLELAEEGVIEQIVDEFANPAQLIEDRQVIARVDAILETLPVHIRSTFEAVLDGDVSYGEAAQHLNVPIGTVRSRVSRVRASVRAQLLQ